MSIELKVIEAAVPPEEWVPQALRELDDTSRAMLKLATQSNTPLEKVFRTRPAKLGLIYLCSGRARPFINRFF